MKNQKNTVPVIKCGGIFKLLMWYQNRFHFLHISSLGAGQLLLMISVWKIAVEIVSAIRDKLKDHISL